MSKNQLGFLLLRIGIASAFIYAAVASLLTPDNWIGYYPIFLRHLLPQNLLLGGFAFYELVLAVWLILGKYTFFASILSALTLSSVVIFNLGQIDIVFRDVAIIFAAISLA